MSRDVRTKYTSTTSTVTSLSVALPAHASGDLLGIFVSVNRSGATFSCAGWTEGANSSGSSPSVGFIYKFATSSSEANPTIAHDQAGQQMQAYAIVIKDAHQTSTIHASAGASATDDTITTPTATVSEANTLVLNALATTADHAPLMWDSGARQIGHGDNNSAASMVLGAHTCQASSGSTDAHTAHNGFGSAAYTALTVCIRDDGNGYIEGQVDPASPPSTLLHPLFASGGTYYGGDLQHADGHSDPTALITALDGTSTAYKAPTSFYSAFEGVTDTLNERPEWMRFNVASSGDFNKPLIHQLRLAAGRDMTGKVLSVSASFDNTVTENLESGGVYAGVVCGGATNDGAKVWKIAARDTIVSPAGGIFPYQFAVEGTPLASFGTFDVTDVHKLVMAVRVTATAAVNSFAYIHELGTMAVVAGSATRPASFASGARHAKTASLRTVQNQSGQAAGQFYLAQSFQIGNGTDATYWNSANQSAEYAAAYDEDGLYVHSNVPAGTYTLSVYASASDTINLSSTTLNLAPSATFLVHASSSTSATYTLDGLTIIGDAEVRDIGVAWSGVTFTGFGTFTKNDADLSGGCTFSNSTGAQAVTIAGATQAALQAELDDLANCTLSGNTVGLRIEFTGTGDVALDMSGIKFPSNTTDIHYNATSASALTVTLENGSNPTTSAYSGSATGVTLVAPTSDFTITSNVSATIRIFTAGTQTLIDSTTGTSLAYTYTGTPTYDVTVAAAGYIQKRVAGQVMAGADVNVSVELEVDPTYNASHGLAYTTDFTYDRSTSELSLVTRQTGRNFHSALSDAFIAQTSLYNTPYPVAPNGPDSMFLIDGAEIASGDEDNWYETGIRYVTIAGATAAEWVSLKSVGTIPSGATGEYQQVDGSSTTDARATGIINQIVKVYGDGTHGSFDYRDHLTVKFQVNGYREARSNVLTAYGISALEPLEYTVAMEPVALTAASGDPAATGITITDHGASPVTWLVKDYSVTVTDAGANSGETIVRELNYNLSLDATYNGKDPFNWPEMVIEAGGAYETARGVTEGGTGAALKGVRVIRGSDPHPDFTRFQADDGTYYTVPVTSSISITGMTTAGADIRMQLFNTTALAASNWAPSTAYSVGDIRLRTSGIGSESTAGLFIRCTTPGTSNDTEPTWDTTVGNTTADTAGTGAGDVVWTTYAVMFHDADPGASSFADTFTDGEEFLTGEGYEIRFAEHNGSTSFKIAQTTGLVAASGISVALTPVANDVFAENALDGSAYETTYSPNYSASYLVLDTNTDYSLRSMFAYYCYSLTTANGMYLFWGGVTATDVANYLIKTAVLDLYLDETDGFVKQTDIARLSRDDGARPALDPTTGGNGLEVNWRNPVYVATVTGGNVITGDIADVPTAAENATAVGAHAVDGTRTLEDAIKIVLAATGGTRLDADTDTIRFRNQANDADVISHTTDADGNTVALTLSP